MDWWIVGGILLIIWIALQFVEIDVDASENEEDTEESKDHTASRQHTDDFSGTNELKHTSRGEELADEAYRRKQNQGSIEDRRGPGRF
jgi:hypothetical protein